MPKLKKVTYCQSCGQSNPWVMQSKTSLMQKPKFCCSCGINLVTGQKPVEQVAASEAEGEEEYTPIPTNIPPLELDMEASYFPKRDSQTLGSLVDPARTGEEDT